LCILAVSMATAAILKKSTLCGDSDFYIYILRVVFIIVVD
jgi:hypothetical protein